MNRKVWIIYTDTHNGATDFEVYGTEEAAQAGYVHTVNEVFSVDCKTFDEAQDFYEVKSQNGLNDDWIRYEEAEVKGNDDPNLDPYRKAAKAMHHHEGELEIDDNALVSKGERGGAYVQAWIWVSDEEVKP